MAKMTPEQEASYALDFGVARSDLPPDAQLAYDCPVAQRARAAATAPVSRANAEAAGGHAVLPRWVAAAGTALVFSAGQGGGVVLLPYAFTRWQPGTPPWPVAVRAIGVALITVGGIMVLTGFVRFATEGLGIPFPAEPTSRQLTVGGPRRFGGQYEAYANRCPVGGRARHAERRDITPHAEGSTARFSELRTRAHSRYRYRLPRTTRQGY